LASSMLTWERDLFFFVPTRITAGRDWIHSTRIPSCLAVVCVVSRANLHADQPSKLQWHYQTKVRESMESDWGQSISIVLNPWSEKIKLVKSKGWKVKKRCSYNASWRMRASCHSKIIKINNVL
jgi:hypothetical protein